jgi:hypothetical protein
MPHSFCQSNQAQRITNTVFFKHKYITQPTVTPADYIMQAYQNLAKALQVTGNAANNPHLEAIQRIQEAHEPGHQCVIEKHAARRPMVEPKLNPLPQEPSS